MSDPTLQHIELISFKPLFKEDRTFEGWGSVELKDSQGDLIPIDVFEKIMPTVMRRGGVVMDSHTSRHIGQLTHWEIKNKDDGNKGLWLEGQVFNDTSVEDEVWDSIKSGEYKGFSLGGRALAQSFELDGGVAYNKIKDAEIWEWSVVRDPANRGAIIEDFNYMAKQELQKPFADYKDFADCVSKNPDAENPEAYCAAIHHQATGTWPTEKAMELSKRIKEETMAKDKKKQEEEETTPQTVEEAIEDIKEVVAELAEEVEKIKKRKQEDEEKPPEPPEEVDEEEEEEEKSAAKKKSTVEGEPADEGPEPKEGEAESVVGQPEEEQVDTPSEPEDKATYKAEDIKKIIRDELKSLNLIKSTTPKPKSEKRDIFKGKGAKLTLDDLKEKSWIQTEQIVDGLKGEQAFD